jgi:bifunctional UDP-N-acetylglucosamine pyrophosphorylase/glucosamine-1-phosphate N-acetyltransferase
VLYGDVPLLRAATIDQLLVAHASSGAAVTFLSMRVPDPTGYGRILYTEDGGFAGIVEHRDATPEQRRIDEVNSGICVFSYPVLEPVLDELQAHNDQGELYLTDTVELIRRAGYSTHVVCGADYREMMGVNTVEQLAEAERIHAIFEEDDARRGARTRGA